MERGATTGDGEYWIDPQKNGDPLKVYCDMTTDGGKQIINALYVLTPCIFTAVLTKSKGFEKPTLHKYNAKPRKLKNVWWYVSKVTKVTYFLDKKERKNEWMNKGVALKGWPIQAAFWEESLRHIM